MGRTALDKLSKEEILGLQFSERFVSLMRNQAITAFYRHGPTSGNVDTVDMLKEAVLRIQHYLETGNQEGLIDAANFCMIEFMWPRKHENPTLQTEELIQKGYQEEDCCKARADRLTRNRAFFNADGSAQWLYAHEGD